MVAREPAGGETADADADREEGAEQADVKLVQVEQFFAEEKYIDLDQRAEKPKIRDADHGEPKRTLGRKRRRPSAISLNGLSRNSFAAPDGGTLGDSQAGQIAEDRDGDHHQADAAASYISRRKKSRCRATCPK